MEAFLFYEEGGYAEKVVYPSPKLCCQFHINNFYVSLHVTRGQFSYNII